MNTQRINAYKNDIQIVYFIEQYDPELKEWFTVGDAYDKIEYADAQVGAHNMKQLAKKLFEVK